MSEQVTARLVGVMIAVSLPSAVRGAELMVRPSPSSGKNLPPDVIRETTTYRGSLQRGTIDCTAPYSVAITERIEIKHVHYLNLVPRG